jgi:hypothetical protein
MEALLKEIAEAKKRLPKSKTQLKVLESLLAQQEDAEKQNIVQKTSEQKQWKKILKEKK